MRRACAREIPLLVSLMDAFYAEGGYRLDRDRAAGSFAEVIADERLGYAWIIEAEQQDVGHVVVTFRYGMEYAGMIAVIDDLYVKPEWRNKGLTTNALREIKSFCEILGMRAITVEVGSKDASAQAVYRKVGFAAMADRESLALPLAPLAHVL